MADYFRRLACQLLSSLATIATAAVTALGMSRALGLFRSIQTSGVPGAYEVTTIPIMDEGMIVVIVSVLISPYCLKLAAKGAGIGRATVLGMLSGVLMAGIIAVVSRCGLSEGTPLGIAAVVAANVVGYSLRFGLNPAAQGTPGTPPPASLPLPAGAAGTRPPAPTSPPSKTRAA
jgi:hypothetical protein